MAVQTQIQWRRGTASSWTSTNPTLAAGEVGYETDTGKYKVGNGSSVWTSLAYAGGATAVTYLFNATSGQTTFSGADANGLTLAYTVGAEQVYLNGVLQVRGSDYTATNGTSIVLTSGAITGDVLNVIAYSAMSVTDTYTQAQADAKFVQNALVDAKGDLFTATADNTPARLAVGSNNQVLTADSSTATGLKWATPAGGGKVLQVVYGSTSTFASSTSTTYADTNLSATITPSSSSSKVLVLVTQQGCGRASSTAGGYMKAKLLRDSTDILLISDVFAFTGGSVTIQNNGNTLAANYLDSPATTSAVTYKTQYASASAGLEVTCQYYYTAQANNKSTIILMEIGA